jgi:hypothetical protein
MEEAKRSSLKRAKQSQVPRTEGEKEELPGKEEHQGRYESVIRYLLASVHEDISDFSLNRLHMFC